MRLASLVARPFLFASIVAAPPFRRSALVVTVVRAAGPERGEAFARTVECDKVGWNAVADAYRKEMR